MTVITVIIYFFAFVIVRSKDKVFFLINHIACAFIVFSQENGVTRITRCNYTSLFYHLLLVFSILGYFYFVRVTFTINPLLIFHEYYYILIKNFVNISLFVWKSTFYACCNGFGCFIMKKYALGKDFTKLCPFGFL